MNICRFSLETNEDLPYEAIVDIMTCNPEEKYLENSIIKHSKKDSDHLDTNRYMYVGKTDYHIIEDIYFL